MFDLPEELYMNLHMCDHITMFLDPLSLSVRLQRVRDALNKEKMFPVKVHTILQMC